VTARARDDSTATLVGVEQPSGLDSLLNLADFEGRAQEELEKPAFDYLAGGSGDELTLSDNPAGWRRWRLLPRVLVDVSRIDTATRVLAGELRLPIGLAPMAFQHHAHREAELASARAAARAGALYCLSTMSSRSLEEVAAAAEEAGHGPRWFQLYVHRDRARSADLVRRAQSAGFSAIVLTADFPVAGNRERDVRNRLPYPQAYGNFSLEAGASEEGLLPLAIGGLNDSALEWDDLAWLRDQTALPLVIKGILRAEDAALAVEQGAAGVWVSNHGGRQLDRTPATADVLAEVVDAVGPQAEVYVDGGIRRGVDVLTALALGARVAFVGRPMGYALALGGEAGVTRALALLSREISTDMALLGVTELRALSREYLRRT
jgi:4-hydroxymandelate oxidase